MLIDLGYLFEGGKLEGFENGMARLKAGDQEGMAQCVTSDARGLWVDLIEPPYQVRQLTLPKQHRTLPMQYGAFGLVEWKVGEELLFSMNHNNLSDLARRMLDNEAPICYDIESREPLRVYESLGCLCVEDAKGHLISKMVKCVATPKLRMQKEMLLDGRPVADFVAKERKRRHM